MRKHRAVVPVMTRDEFRACLRRLAISQVGLGKVLGRDARTVRRWALGEVVVPSELAMLLRLMVRMKIKFPKIPKKS